MQNTFFPVHTIKHKLFSAQIREEHPSMNDFLSVVPACWYQLLLFVPTLPEVRFSLC